MLFQNLYDWLSYWNPRWNFEEYPHNSYLNFNSPYTLYVKEQHGHSSKHLILCSTEERRSLKFVTVYIVIQCLFMGERFLQTRPMANQLNNVLLLISNFSVLLCNHMISTYICNFWVIDQMFCVTKTDPTMLKLN